MAPQAHATLDLPHVRNLVRLYSKKAGIDYEDALQDALVAIFSAIPMYRPWRGSMENFLTSCVKMQLILRIKQEQAMKPPPSPSGDFDAPGAFAACHPSRDSFVTSPAKSPTMETRSRLGMLTKKEGIVLRLRLRGFQYKDMPGKDMPGNPKDAENCFRRVVLKMRNWNSFDYEQPPTKST